MTRSFTSLTVVCSTDAPHISDRAYPSVCLSNVWHLPVADVMPAIAKGVCAPSGLRMRLTAITLATSLSLRTSAARAKLVATSPAEHAVSIIAHAPCSPSTYERRPDAIDPELPVAEYTLFPSGLVASTCAKSELEYPRYTPV